MTTLLDAATPAPTVGIDMERITEYTAEIFTRQSDLANPRQLQVPITLVGIGATGSHVAVALAKMGCGDITLYDDDVVALHNWPNQLFNVHGSVGKAKVDVCADVLWHMAAVHPTAIASKLPQDIFLEGIVISGVDRMDARQSIWASVKNQPTIRRYIDCRMGAQVGNLLHINPCDPQDIAWYEQHLPDDDQTSDLPCTARSIVFTQFGMAAMVTALVRQELCEDVVTMPRQLMFDFQHGIVCHPDIFHAVIGAHLAAPAPVSAG